MEDNLDSVVLKGFKPKAPQGRKLVLTASEFSQLELLNRVCNPSDKRQGGGLSGYIDSDVAYMIARKMRDSKKVKDEFKPLIARFSKFAKTSGGFFRV